MGTPSEVLAGIILDQLLGFEEVKYINKAIDYTATKDGKTAIIEVKNASILKPKQMKALAQELLKGNLAYLIVTNKSGDYCLFQLASTNLTPPIPKSLPQTKTQKIQKSGKSTNYVVILKKSMKDLGWNPQDTKVVQIPKPNRNELVIKAIST